MTITSLILRSPTTNTAAPFVVGHAFKKGDVPAGSQLVGSFSDFQVTPKNVWPDGSLKFAVLSGRAAITGGVDLSVPLSIGTPASSTALTTTNLKATGVVASIGCGAFGTVSWSTTDWDSPFSAWVSGPKMSSWIYRKPVGSDTHLVTWLEVRLWSGGEVEVLPWIENGYLRVTAPTNKSATYTFTLGGTQRVSVAINLMHHQRTPLINGAELGYWLAADPAIIPRHDVAYLQATELVPSYSASLSPSSANATALVSTYTPMQAGNIIYDSDTMSSSGYQAPIGLLPLYDVMYLVCDAPNGYGAVVRNGFSSGRFSIHYRDESTNRPARFSTNPTIVITVSQGFKDTGTSTINEYTPVATGSNGPQWDCAHSPSLGYMAYLLTGRWYFMEEVQFVATVNYLGNGDNTALRTGSLGLMQPAVDAWQTRSCAWGMRALAQALCVTPDSDTTLQTEFANSFKSNIDHFHGRYVAQANNPFGFIQSGTAGYNGGTSLIPPWQQDFFTGVIGYTVSLGLPIPSTYQTKLAAFFAWTAQSIVGRMSAPGAGFPYMNADVYSLSISPTEPSVPNYATGAGPWRSTWADVYSAEVASLTATSSPTGWLTTDPNILAGEIMPGARALWGNLHPAISYAVRHGVTGAQAAYSRMTAATNYSSLTAEFTTHPVWSVKPAIFPAGVVAMIGQTARTDNTSLVTGKAVAGNRGLGVFAQNVSSVVGPQGTSPLYDSLQLPADNNYEVRWRVVTWPTLGGTLALTEDGKLYYSGPADTCVIEIYMAGVSKGTAILTFATSGTTVIPVSLDLPLNYSIAAYVLRDLQVSYSIISNLQIIVLSRTITFGGGINSVTFDGGTNTVVF